MLWREADLYCLGFPKNWSKVKDDNTVVSYWFETEEKYEEKVKNGKYRSKLGFLKPNLFKLEYHLHSETMFVSGDVDTGLF
jgi:hypothetical protein